MDKTMSTAARVVMWLSAFVTGEILQIPSMISALLVLMVIDMVTGVLSAWIQHNWDSTTCIDGVIKKALILMIILAVRVTENAAAQAWELDKFEAHIDQVLTFGFIFATLISIVENCALGQIWLPEVLVINLIRFKKIRMFRQASDAQLEELRRKRPNEDLQ